MHESEKWKWSCSVMSDSSRPHGLQPTRLLRPWDFQGKSTGVGRHCLLPVCMSLPYFVIYNSLFCFLDSTLSDIMLKRYNTSVFLPGESRAQRSLVVYSPPGLQRVGHDWATNTLSDITPCLSLTIRLILRSVISWNSIHVASDGKISPFHGCVAFHGYSPCGLKSWDIFSD